MRKYEIMVLVRPEVDDRQVPALIEKHLEVITKGGGTVDNTDVWGRRRLAYDIRIETNLKITEASYVVLQVSAEPATVAEMDRLMTIDEKIVRTKVLRLEDSKK